MRTHFAQVKLLCLLLIAVCLLVGTAPVTSAAQVRATGLNVTRIASNSGTS